MNIREARIRSGAQAKELVGIVRAAGFPKYDKTIHSKVERPAEYGIRLVTAAESAIKTFCGLDAHNPAKPDRHRIKTRVQFRPTDEAHRRLQQAQIRHGNISMQELMTTITNGWLDADERK